MISNSTTPARTPAERTAYIKALVDASPEFTIGQMDRLTALLRPEPLAALVPLAA
ncbi:hypothetical protein [Cryobacterium sp. 10I5]|uniref:hypothetical protein n=1 Tax=Cryobacterium sp. 10I5 TaxID=3048581 RepID=UPI002B22BE20|nr:hypothetical protein [Cryobacterium sp. 10I5]MEB0266885.1 hypothetical protein [Cryobacterium sp. 10I5]